MRKSMIAAVIGVVGLGVAGTLAIAAQGDAPMRPNFERMADNRAALLDAELAGLKAALKLNPDQEKLWSPFETSVRDAAKERDDAMKAMREARKPGDARPAPLDRLDMLATRMEDGAKALHSIAAAGKPLYASLDADQQERFGFLARALMMHHQGGGMGPRDGMGPHGGGMGMGGPDGDAPPPPPAQP
jgi:hypothetical protein